MATFHGHDIDRLAYAKCGGGMKVVSFIEPPKAEVIEKIIKRCGSWYPASPRRPRAGNC